MRPPLGDRDARPPSGLPDKPERAREMKKLRRRLVELQGALFAERKRSLLVVLQARDAGGKDGTIRRVFGPLGPEGCVVTSFKVPTAVERSHDFLWRAHQAVPPRGIVGVFNRSHYEDVLAARVRRLVAPSVWRQRYAQINDFERMLGENGVTVIKFFLHISREEQKERFLERLREPRKNWKFSPGDLDDRAHWDDYTRAYRDAIAECGTEGAPWYVVPADRKRVRDYLVARVMVDTLERLRPRHPRATREVLALADRIE